MPPADIDGLASLQAAHLIAVPFENLDVWAGQMVRCDEAWVLDKIVARGRGGCCFELNGGFAALLDHAGFAVTRLAATVLLDDTQSPLPDHLTLRVELDRPYLVDVGFGVGTPRRPVPFAAFDPHNGGPSLYRFTGGDIVERRRNRDGSWERCFRIEHAVELADLEPSSAYLQSTDNVFTAAPFATRALDDTTARVTWNRDRLVIHRDGSETITAQPDPESTLREWFGITGASV